MKLLLTAGDNAPTRVCASDAITPRFILDESLAEAKAAAAPGKEVGPPTIASRSNAMDEADHRNLTN